MRGSLSTIAAAAGLSVVLGQGLDASLVVNPKNSPGVAGSISSLPVDISGLRNNRGFGNSPNDADFDGTGSSYPAEFLPAESFTYGGVDFIFPQYQENNGSDNVLAEGQTLNITSGRYIGVHMLTAAESAIATGFVNATYADGSTTSGAVLVDPFWAWPYPYGGDIIFPYHLTNETVDYNRSMIFRSVTWLDSSKELTSLQLPNVTSGAANGPGGAAEQTRLHIFAVSLIPADAIGSSLNVELARSTNTWVEGTNKTQIFEAIINNVGTDWVLANQSVTVSIESDGVQTVQPGYINRLRPGDQARVQIGVVNADGVAEGTDGTATLVISGTGVSTNYTFNATYGIREFEPTYESIYAHESPPWFNNAKYGIFIHWGVYAVPGWGNSGDNESYAEWYWWWMNSGPNSTRDRTYEYHLETYGPDVVYDDFIANFTASQFDPKEWVDLFADAGANYFVQVSKHHDGYAIFDLPANVTERTSVAQFPHRNLLQEIFDAAEEHQPQLHKATYYSLPEWFHPDYRPLGFASWPGGNATNPYTNETLPYTGYVPLNDYVTDKILPEMRTLANMGTEVMWCDIGGPNLTAQFAAEYFNNAARQGKQVLTNNRCGTPGDFDTPEYARYEAVQVRKWESNLGMDPFSYGYNRATPDDKYLTAQGIVTSLVDIVSKNGNFLLDVGPTAEGKQNHIPARRRLMEVLTYCPPF
jgi:alpha-L-fucosidase